MSEISYAERVPRGIALLDETGPTWATDVNLASLDIRAGNYCMTAQYAEIQGSGWYAVGQDLLGLTDEDYELHGFNADGASTTDHADDQGYSVLNDLWKTEIIRRREAAQSESDAR